VKRKLIVFIGRDDSRWHFEQLTGFEHPRTNNLKTLRKFAQAALDTDKSLARYEIVTV